MTNKNVQWRCVSSNIENFTNSSIDYPNVDNILQSNRKQLESSVAITNDKYVDIPDDVDSVTNEHPNLHTMPLLGEGYTPHVFNLVLPEGSNLYNGSFNLSAQIPKKFAEQSQTMYVPVHNDTHIIDANNERNNHLGVENGLPNVPGLTKEIDLSVTAYHGPNLPHIVVTDTTPHASAIGSAPGVASAIVRLVGETPTYAPTNAPTYAPTNSTTYVPTNIPTYVATFAPTLGETASPTHAPTLALSLASTFAPTLSETATPTRASTNAPTRASTNTPTRAATFAPTLGETVAPEASHAGEPTENVTITNAVSYSSSNQPSMLKKLIKSFFMYVVVALLIYFAYLLYNNTLDKSVYTRIILGVVVAYVIYYYFFKNRK